MRLPDGCICSFPAGACIDTHCRCHHHGYPAPQPAPDAPKPVMTLHTCWDNHEGEDGGHADGSPCRDKATPLYAQPAPDDPCVGCGKALMECADNCCDDCDHPWPQPAPDAPPDEDYLWVRVRELLNNLGIVGPNIPHRVDEDPGPDLPGEEGTEWCVCGRIWPCEARQLDGCIDLMLEDAQRFRAAAGVTVAPPASDPGPIGTERIYTRKRPQPDEDARLRRQAYLAYLYLNIVNCPKCNLPSAQGLVCPCGYDGAD